MLSETSETARWAERVRLLATGQVQVVDLRDAEDVVEAASAAINRLHEANKDVDQFVIDAAQEMKLYGALGRAKYLLGCPLHVAYAIAEDDR